MHTRPRRPSRRLIFLGDERGGSQGAIIRCEACHCKLSLNKNPRFKFARPNRTRWVQCPSGCYGETTGFSRRSEMFAGLSVPLAGHVSKSGFAVMAESNLNEKFVSSAAISDRCSGAAVLAASMMQWTAAGFAAIAAFAITMAASGFAAIAARTIRATRGQLDFASFRVAP